MNILQIEATYVISTATICFCLLFHISSKTDFDEKPFKDNVCFKSTRIDGESVYEQIGFQDKHTSRYINHKKPEFRLYNVDGEKYHGPSLDVNFKKSIVNIKLFEKGHPTKELTQDEVKEYKIEAVGPKNFVAKEKSAKK